MIVDHVYHIDPEPMDQRLWKLSMESPQHGVMDDHMTSKHGFTNAYSDACIGSDEPNGGYDQGLPSMKEIGDQIGEQWLSKTEATKR